MMAIKDTTLIETVKLSFPFLTPNTFKKKIINNAIRAIPLVNCQLQSTYK